MSPRWLNGISMGSSKKVCFSRVIGYQSKNSSPVISEYPNQENDCFCSVIKKLHRQISCHHQVSGSEAPNLDRFALLKQSEEGPVMRMLQVPELQAAMGFPVDFKIKHGTRRDRIHMLGNAVCPPLIQTILEQMLRLS